MLGHSDKSDPTELEGGEPYAELKPQATWCYFNPHKAAALIESLQQALIDTRGFWDIAQAGPHRAQKLHERVSALLPPTLTGGLSE